MARQFVIYDLRHPTYLSDSTQWEEWRLTFAGGKEYLQRYLKKFSDRESDADFNTRKALTPITTFAKSAVLDVRNNIYQRLTEVVRNGGSTNYQNAIAGVGGGVDGKGSTMDTFMGIDVLTEALQMGKVGVYVDAAPATGPTLADQSFPPYLTYYRVEDILAYSYAPRSKGGEFESVLLRDYSPDTISIPGTNIAMPTTYTDSYRLIWKDEEGQVWYRIYDAEGSVVPNLDADDPTSGAVLTGLKRVPFVMVDINGSLMKDIASYQNALLNLASSDVYYAIKSNTPFLTIQTDGFNSGSHLKKADTAEGAEGNDVNVGAGKGRYYGVNEERPQFIAPPTETLLASMQLQERLEQSIRNLINLAVQNKSGSRTESAEAKKVGQSGMEAGLSFIGTVMEQAEMKIAQIWAEYENTQNPNAAVVKYPDRYTLKSDWERLEEAEKTVDLIDRLPTQELKREVSKMLAAGLIGGKVDREVVDEIKRLIDSNPYILTTPADVIAAQEAGLVSDVTASEALGYAGEEEVAQAKQDKAERAVLVLAAQTSPNQQAGVTNPAARGVPELDTNPNSGADERDGDEVSDS